MQKTFVFALLVALAVSQRFNLDDCSCDPYNNYYAINCPVVGIPNNAKWTYTDLPDGWYSVDEVIFAPRGRFNENEIYGVKVDISSPFGNSFRFRRSLLFSFLHDEIRHVTDFDYDFDDRKIYNSVIQSSKVVTYPTSAPPRKTLLGGLIGAVFGIVGAVAGGIINTITGILNALGGNIKPYFPYGPHRNVVFRGDKGNSIEYQLNELGNMICDTNRVGGGAGLNRYVNGILQFKAHILEALLNKKFPY